MMMMMMMIIIIIIIIIISCGGVRLSQSGTSATNWSIVPAPDDDCGAFWWNAN
jgi:hypothetical protein